ncbi:MAG: hypothetical protein JST87_16715 [Bacteroidetes bacterium]|nr:hypothetical protein [Bacteroidota bacterium]
MPKWSQILAQNGTGKSYDSFLKWLIEVNYFNEREEKITIKEIATAFKLETVKVTKWLHEIYEDLLDLNYESPQLFTDNKIEVACHFSYYDSSAIINLGLNIIPRVYEYFHFYFVKAKIGTNCFWVSDIHHEMNNDSIKTNIWLDGGILNKYREMAIEEAKHKGYLSQLDVWNMTNSEIDEIIGRNSRR